MADVITTIGATGSPTTPDYSTLQAWEDDIPADLVSADERHIGECLNQGTFTDATESDMLTIAGHTTDATRNIILRCATGASFIDHADVRTNALFYNASNGVAISKTGNYNATIKNDTQYTRLEGLQIKSKSKGTVLECTVGSSAISGLTVDSCIIYADVDGDASANVSKCIVATDAGTLVINSLLVSETGGAANEPIDTRWAEVYGCTVIGLNANTTAAFKCAYSTFVLKNCAVFGFNSFSVANGGATFTQTYCATDLTAPSGTGNVGSLTFADQFESSTNDFRAVSTGDLQAGTPDATNTPDDITGLTRDATTPWMGAWEVAGAGGRTTKNTRSHPLGISLGVNRGVTGAGY